MRLIDVRHLGRERVIGCWELDGVLIDPGPTSSMENLIEQLGGEQPRALLLTHIHLDHAGASGSLVRRWPDLPVYVHERGARHLADPAKLLASAERLYGDQMERLWGEVAPVPEANLRPLSGGEEVLGFKVAYTPGHASHHVSYFDEQSGIAWAGDTAGLRFTSKIFTLPPTPPPDIDLEAWRESIATLRTWGPETVFITHFGPYGNVPEHLDDLERSLAAAADVVKRIMQTDAPDDAKYEQFKTAVFEYIHAAGIPEDEIAPLEHVGPLEFNWRGLVRYWKKRGL